jgi:L-ascorbate metabolism protein UlaG (beta-lactamase superfamily)
MLSTRGNQITWLGHSAFRITTPGGKVILIDPFLENNPSCPAALKKPDRVDAILISHGHSDHVGDAVALGKRFSPEILCMYEISVWLASKGVKNVTGMSKGGTARAADVEVTMTQAIHSSSMQDGGQVIYMGEPCGLLVRLPGGLTIYHAGDTGVFSDMKIISELYAPEIACLPIGDLYTMGPREAALAIRLLGVRHVVPMHFGTFPALTGRPETVRELTKDISGLEIHALKPGESLGA